MTNTLPQHIHNKRKRLHRPKLGTKTHQEREKLLLLLQKHQSYLMPSSLPIHQFTPITFTVHCLAQTRVLRLSESSKVNLTRFLQVSPGEKQARLGEFVSFSPLFSYAATNIDSNQHAKAFHAFTKSHQPQNRKNNSRTTKT